MYVTVRSCKRPSRQTDRKPPPGNYTVDISKDRDFQKARNLFQRAVLVSKWRIGVPSNECTYVTRHTPKSSPRGGPHSIQYYIDPFHPLRSSLCCVVLENHTPFSLLLPYRRRRAVLYYTTL